MKFNVVCSAVDCRSFMIKLNAEYVENESYHLKFSVVFVTVICPKVKLKVV